MLGLAVLFGFSERFFNQIGAHAESVVAGDGLDESVAAAGSPTSSLPHLGNGTTAAACRAVASAPNATVVEVRTNGKAPANGKVPANGTAPGKRDGTANGTAPGNGTARNGTAGGPRKAPANGEAPPRARANGRRADQQP